MSSVLVAIGLLVAVAVVLTLSAQRYYRYLLDRSSTEIPTFLRNNPVGPWFLWRAERSLLVYFMQHGRFPPDSGVFGLPRRIVKALIGLFAPSKRSGNPSAAPFSANMQDLLARYDPDFSLQEAMKIMRDSIAGKGEYRSQIAQDYFLNKWFFRNHKRGVFVNVGAYDGVSGSNTYFFEKSLDWHGLALEPQPQPYEKLVRARKCKAVNACAYDSAGSVQFRQFVAEEKPGVSPDLSRLPPLLTLKSSGIHSGDMLAGIASHFDNAHSDRIEAASEEFQAKSALLTVKCIRLSDLLEENKLWVVDFLSINVEGAELKVLHGLDLSRFRVNVMSIERSASFPHIRELLGKAGFEHAGLLFWDDIYVNKSLRFSWEQS